MSKSSAMEEAQIDGGWAWMVVLGSWIIYIFLVGGIKSMGIFFVEFQEMFDASAAAIAALMGVLSVFMSIFAPVSTIFYERYGARITVIIAGIMCSVAGLLATVAPSMLYVILVFGVIFGIGLGLVFNPTTVVVGEYFEKYRSLAMGLSMTGGSVGQLAIPIILRLLIDEYTFRGALLIYSALLLHIVVGAMLFRPLPNLPSTMPNEPMQEETEIDMKEPISIVAEERERNDSVANDSVHRFLSRSRHNSRSRKDSLTSRYNRLHMKCTCDKSRTSSKMHDLSLVNGQASKSRSTSDITKAALLSKSPNSTKKSDTSDLDQPTFRRRVPTKSVCEPSDILCEKCSNTYMTSMKDLKYVFPSTGALFVPSKLGNGQLQENAEESTDEEMLVKHSKPSKFSFLRALCDIYLFKNPLFVIFLIGICTGNAGYINIFLFLPPFMKEYGFSKADAALMLSIAGICDLIGRLIGGFIADYNFLRRHSLIAISIGITGVVCILCTTLVVTFWGLVTLSIVIGAFGGSYIALMAVVLVDFVGIKKMPAGFGMTLMFMGLSSAALPSLLGYLKDSTETFSTVFIICAGLMILSALLFFLPHLIRKVTNTTEEERIQQMEELEYRSSIKT